MAFELPKCGGLKFNTGSFQQIGNVVTDINATAISGGVVTACGQQFDEAYFKVIGHTVTMPTVTTAPTTTFKGNCGLQFDSAKFDLDEDGAIEYNPDIVTTLTFTTTPADATVTVVDHNDMFISESSTAGVYPVLIGGSYTYTVSKAGYITETATVTISTALTVDITLEQPTLTIAVSPADATVTVVDAEGAAVVGVAGVYTVNMGGTYTYTVSKTGYVTQGAEIEIENAVEEVDVTLNQALSDTFADNEWSAIIGACQSGSVPAAWVVGNQKAMNINGASYTVTIIGKGHDTYTAGGTAPLTFQLQDCYGTKYQMNSSDTNSGGWTSCAMRSTHLPAILALMPSEVQAGIKQVNKLSSAGSQSSTINTTADKLFLLSEIEIFGSITNSKSGEGSQYAYYSAGNSKVKNLNGSANSWWERSPYGNYTTTFCRVNSSGIASNSNASDSYGVAFGFCF